jgi:hypothetical protein
MIGLITEAHGPASVMTKESYEREGGLGRLVCAWVAARLGRYKSPHNITVLRLAGARRAAGMKFSQLEVPPIAADAQTGSKEK